MVKKVLFGFLFALTGLASNTVDAQVTVTQVGGDLFVFGGAADDSVYLLSTYFHFYYGYYYEQDNVQIYNAETGTYHFYFDVDKVWLDTGNGDDYVNMYENLGGADICVTTGNGNDSVYSSTRMHRTIEINTGNQDDYVQSYSAFSANFGGSISINMENGNDLCNLVTSEDNVDVDLGNGNDTLIGSNPFNDSYGTLNGGNGMDSCTGFESYGSLSIVNCEN